MRSCGTWRWSERFGLWFKRPEEQGEISQELLRAPNSIEQGRLKQETYAAHRRRHRARLEAGLSPFGED